MCVLVAFEDTHRAYGDAIVKAIRSSYPRLKVLEVAGLRELQAPVALFGPHLLISISHAVSLANGHGRLSDPADHPVFRIRAGEVWTPIVWWAFTL